MSPYDMAGMEVYRFRPEDAAQFLAAAGLRLYTLSAAGEPVPEVDPVEWFQWMAGAERVVAVSRVGSVVLTTSYAGIDFARANGGPLVFESVLACPGHPLRGWRYATLREARMGHEKLVELLQRAEGAGL